MNIKELAEQAGFMFNTLGATYPCGSLSETLERFAELVRQDEREANAKLCDAIEFEEQVNERLARGAYMCGKAIRARGREIDS